MSFLEYFNNKLLEEKLEIEKAVYESALRSYESRKQKMSKEHTKSLDKLNNFDLFELPYKIRELGVKIKHFDPKNGKVNIQLFDAESLLTVTKYIKDIGIKNFDVNESNLEISIKQG